MTTKRPMKDTDSRIAMLKQSLQKLQPLLLYLLALLTLLISAGIIGGNAYQRAHEAAFDRSAARADLASAFIANGFLSGQYNLFAIAEFVEPLIEASGLGADVGLESIQGLLDEKIQDAGFIDAFFITDLSGRSLYSSVSPDSSNQPLPLNFIERYLTDINAGRLVTP